MNKIILAIIAVVVVGGAIAYVYYNDTDQSSPIFAGETFTVSCEAGPDMQFQYATDDTSVMQYTVGQMEYVLTQARTASGVKYESNDGFIMYWEHQGEAMVDVGDDSYSGCAIAGENEAAGATDGPFLGKAASWPSFSNESLTEDWTMSLQVPAEVESSNPQQGIYSFKYIGPDSQPDTEITDGFLLTITAEADTSLPDYLDKVEAPTGAETITFNGYEAASFTRPSELGEQRIPHIVFALPDNTTLIDITKSAYGEKSATYRAAMERMLDTLTFTNLNEEEEVASDLIDVTAPVTGATVSSPISLSGEAKGYWFFEADAPVTVSNADGQEIGEGHISADGNWMTEDFVSFTGEIEYEQSPGASSSEGTVTFHRANPSGLPENDMTVEVSVELDQQGQQKIF